jgi:hypothetical protein
MSLLECKCLSKNRAPYVCGARSDMNEANNVMLVPPPKHANTCASSTHGNVGAHASIVRPVANATNASVNRFGSEMRFNSQGATTA